MATATTVTLRDLFSSVIAPTKAKTTDALDNTQLLLRVAAAVGELTSSQKNGIMDRACNHGEAGRVGLIMSIERIENLKRTVEKMPKPLIGVLYKIEDPKVILNSEVLAFKEKLEGRPSTTAFNRITEGLVHRFDTKERKFVFFNGTQEPDIDIHHPGHFDKGTSNSCNCYVPWYDKNEQARAYAAMPMH
jgi:hypothetical protein